MITRPELRHARFLQHNREYANRSMTCGDNDRGSQWFVQSGTRPPILVRHAGEPLFV